MFSPERLTIYQDRKSLKEGERVVIILKVMTTIAHKIQQIPSMFVELSKNVHSIISGKSCVYAKIVTEKCV